MSAPRELDEELQPEELFDDTGRLMPELAELHQRRPAHGSNPHANEHPVAYLRMPDFEPTRWTCPFPCCQGQDTLVLGEYLRDVVRANQDHRHFRIFGPDETLSNLLGASSRPPTVSGMHDSIK